MRKAVLLLVVKLVLFPVGRCKLNVLIPILLRAHAAVQMIWKSILK